MQNSDLKTAIRDDLSIATGDSFFVDAYIQRLANRSVKWACDGWNWQQTQWAFKRDSEANQEYYNYPENLKTDSIFRLRFNGKTYDRTAFPEYLTYQEQDNPGTDEIFSDYRRQMFIWPIPTSVAEITVWGHLMPDTMSADADTHPFEGEAKIEEALVKYAVGLAKQKMRGTYLAAGIADCRDAKIMLDEAYELQQREQSKYKNKDLEGWAFFDILPLGSNTIRTQRGNFEPCDC